MEWTDSAAEYTAYPVLRPIFTGIVSVFSMSINIAIQGEFVNDYNARFFNNLRGRASFIRLFVQMWTGIVILYLRGVFAASHPALNPLRTLLGMRSGSP